MKNLSSLILLSLLMAPAASFAATAQTISFKCTTDDSQSSQDFAIQSLTLSVKQSTNGVSFVAGSFLSSPAIRQFALLDQNTQIASDLDGTAATDATQDLAIMGVDHQTNMAMLVTLASAGRTGERRLSIDVYPTPLNQAPPAQLEAHLLCTQI